MRRRPTLFRGAFARFLGVGSINTAIDVGIFALLALIGVPILLANAVSTVCGLSFSFAANRRFTFARRGRITAREVVAFVAVTGCGLWALQPLVLLTADRALSPVLGEAPALLLGKLLAVGVGIGWNWFWYSRVLFRVSGRLAPPESDPMVQAL